MNTTIFDTAAAPGRVPDRRNAVVAELRGGGEGGEHAPLSEWTANPTARRERGLTPPALPSPYRTASVKR